MNVITRLQKIGLASLNTFIAVLMLSMPQYGFAQTTGVFNEFASQPDVWHPNGPVQPGVDAKGDLTLTIPVMTVPGRGGLDFDISFNYRSGIRVDQRASWIGMGWGFDPGSITRDPHGFVVNNGDGTFGTHGADYVEQPKWQPDSYYVSFPNGTGTMMRVTQPTQGSTTNPPHRSSASGFYLNDWRAWKIEAFSVGPVTVSAVGGSSLTTARAGESTARDDYSKFIITTLGGVRYVFAHPTLATYKGLLETGNNFLFDYYVGTWRLVAILGHNYENGAPDIPTGDESGSWIRFDYTPVAMASTQGQNPYPTYIQTAYLEKIVTPTHEAVFEKSSRPRENWPDWESGIYSILTAIKLYSRHDTQNTVNEVHLTQSQRFPSPLDNSRLALDALEMQGQNGAIVMPAYEFTYYGTSCSQSPCPLGTSNQDDFGFYDDGFSSAPSDRDSNTNDAKSWSLETIKYPTGGTETYYYTNDQVSSTESVDYKSFDMTVSPPIVGDHTYNFGNHGYSQGGIRVTKIVRSDGVNPDRDIEIEYTYDEPGRVTGVPNRYWSRTYSGAFFSLTERGHVAVYYPKISRRTLPDGGKTEIYYTTPNASVSACSWPDGEIDPLTTMRYTRSGNGFTLIQGNEDREWGRPYYTQILAENGSVIRDTCTQHDTNQAKLGIAWDPPVGSLELNLHWGYADRINFVNERVFEGRTDPITKINQYFYHIDPTEETGLLTSMSESINSKERVTFYTYAFEEYPALKDLNILNPTIRQDVSDGNSVYHQSTITTWKEHEFFNDEGELVRLWNPYQTYAWRANVPSSGSRIFSDWTGVVTTNKCADGQDTDCWQLSSTNQSYNDNGYLTNVKDGLGVNTIFNYRTDIGYNGAYLTRVTRQGLSSNFEYDLRWGLLSKVTGPSGREQSYVYDAFGRLKRVVNDAGVIASTNLYHIKNTPATEPTYVKSVNWNYDAYGGSRHVTSRQYFDGLGRTTHTQLGEVPGTSIFTKTEYDSQGRVWKAWKPYRGSTPPIGQPPAADPLAYYQANTDNNPLSNLAVFCEKSDTVLKPYEETLYKPDPLARPVSITPAYCSSSTADRKRILFHYDINVNLGTLSRVSDENVVYNDTYTDLFGNTTRLYHAANQGSDAFTKMTHDVMGNLTQVQPPERYVIGNTTYAYNTLGQLTAKNTPDIDGAYQYRYDANGNLRFVLDPTRQDANGFLYTKYDVHNRAIESGIYQGTTTFSTANVDDQTWPSEDISEVRSFQYTQGDLTRVSFTSPSGQTSRYEYGYDTEGRVSDIEICLKGMRKEDNTGLTCKKVEYIYDLQSNVTEVHYQPGEADALCHFYSYDLVGRLDSVKVNTSADVEDAHTVAVYSYTATGQVKQLQLGRDSLQAPIQSLDYRYHMRDWLTHINHINLSTVNSIDASGGDLFAMRLGYFGFNSDAPIGAVDRYNGDVSWTAWRTKGNHVVDTGFAGTTEAGIAGYAFDYDYFNRLTEANFSHKDIGTVPWQNNNNFDVSPIEYDRNGNITRLLRNRFGGPQDDFTYVPYAGTNRLCNLDGLPCNTTDPSQNAYVYDPNGNVTKNHLGQTFDYTHFNLPHTVTSNNVTTKYRYDADGMRVYKKIGLVETFYIRGANGEVLAVYDQAPLDGARLRYHNLLSGSSVIGRIEPPEMGTN